MYQYLFFIFHIFINFKTNGFDWNHHGYAKYLDIYIKHIDFENILKILKSDNNEIYKYSLSCYNGIIEPYMNLDKYNWSNLPFVLVCCYNTYES